MNGIKLKMKWVICFSFSVFIALASNKNDSIAESDEASKLKISENNRFLIKENGTPFIWIGDTFWDWDALPPGDLDEYLNKRAAQGFTVVQTQIAVYGGANYAGDWCFGGPNHKDITQPQEAYWQYVDLWLDKIEQHGLYAAVGLSWIINHWARYDKAGDPTVRFSETDYYNYGKWIGNRYKDRENIIWLGLNESTYLGAPKEKIKAVLQGLRDGDTGNKLLTLHPLAGSCTSLDFGDIVDFNSWQTARFKAPCNLPYTHTFSGLPEGFFDSVEDGKFTVWEAIESDYTKLPVKPVIDLEAWYENGPDDMPVDATSSTATPWDVRSRAYFTLFAGAFGHTYGAYRLAYNIKGDSWRPALEFPGGKQMGHIAKLLGDQKRPFLKLTPCQELITRGQSRSYNSHKQAALADDGTYAYVYTADGSSFSLDLTKLGKVGDEIVAQWFNPRDGEFLAIADKYNRISNQIFIPPAATPGDNDWILVLNVSDDIIVLSCNKPLTISNTYANQATVYQYNKFELTFDLAGKWENPFDPGQVQVDGFFTAPSGKSFIVPGFFYQGYEKTTVNGGDTFKPVGNSVWKIRFAPSETGVYTYKIKVVNQGQEISSELDTFLCKIKSSNHGFVRVSKTNPYYFEYDDGTPFFSIANCIYWDKLRDITEGDMETYYTEFARAGGNMTRNFLSRIAELVDPPAPRPDRGFGKIDLDRSWRHDEAFELCEKLGIHHQLAISNGTYFLPGNNPRKEMLVYHPKHGGPVEKLTGLEYLKNPEIKQNFKLILRYFVARWGYSTAVFSWDLWNEVNLIPGFDTIVGEAKEWHREMAHYLEQIDWANHVTHTNFNIVNGYPALDSLPEMDIVSVNTYTSLDFAPSAEYWIKRHLSDYRKPVMFSEFGIGHSYRKEGYAPHDPKYIMAHNGMWSCLMSGSASTGMPIGWNYLKEKHYFDYINAIAQFTEGIPFSKQEWKPVAVKSLQFNESSGTPYYADKFVEGFHMNYKFPDGWKDKEIFKVDKTGQIKEFEYMSGFLGDPLGRNDMTLEINYPANGEFTVFVPEIFLRKQSPGFPILTVSIDGKIVLDKQLANETDNYREIYKQFRIPVAKGKHAIKLANTGGGFFPMGYELGNYVQKNGPDLEVRGLQTSDIILLWLKSPKYTWLYDKMGIQPELQPSGKLILNNVPDGTWVAEWMDTVENRWIRRTIEKSENGKLTITTPAIKNSFAVRLFRNE